MIEANDNNNNIRICFMFHVSYRNTNLNEVNEFGRERGEDRFIFEETCALRAQFNCSEDRDHQKSHLFCNDL